MYSCMRSYKCISIITINEDRGYDFEIEQGEVYGSVWREEMRNDVIMLNFKNERKTWKFSEQV